MYRIALNVAISQLRGRRLRDRHQVPLHDDLHDNGTGDREGPDHDLHVLQRLIAAMPPMDRALLLLYLDERSHREIAEILGTSEPNVARSEERRVGKECVRTCRSRWSPNH